MASMEKISADLKLADSKKDGLRKAFDHSLLLLTLQWNDLQDYFDSTLNSIQQEFQQLQSRENQLEELESREKQLGLSRLSLDEQSRKLDSVQKMIDESFTKLQSKEKELDSVKQSIEWRVREFEAKEKQFKKRCKEIESKEKKFQSIQKSFEERGKELELREKKYEERLKELELREKKYEERLKQLELREAQCGKVAHSKVKVELQEQLSGENHSLAASLQFSVTMDGKHLQMFLNEHVDDHSSMSDDVYRALQLSSDPAKLVLDAMQGFYPPYLKKGDKEFDASVIRRSCTLLLAQLMRVSPQIRPCVKEEAAKVAVNWKAKLKVECENSLEVLGFVQLIGTYRLLPDFDSDEVFKLLETVGQHREAPKLCRVLGFADKVPDFVQGLIKKRQNLAAVRFIHAFELVDKFPPVPILEDYFKYWKTIADETCKKENLTRGETIIAKQSIAALRAVIKCVEDHKLEIDYSLKNLEKCINVLTEKANTRYTSPANPKSQPQQQSSEKNCGSPAVSAPKDQEQQRGNKRPCLAVSEDTPVSAPKDQEQQRGNKRPCLAVSEDTPNASITADSTVHSIHSPHRYQLGRYADRGTSYLVPSRGRYDLGGFHSVDRHMGLYPDRSIHFFARDAPREPCHYDEPVSFHCPVDTFRGTSFYDRTLTFGSHSPRDVPREPCFYDGPVRFDQYDPFRSTFFP
ncbi:hypothetical protein ACSBR2_018028 [Camellia fascicularis]